MKLKIETRFISYILILCLSSSMTWSQENIKTDVKIKILSSEESLATGLNYVKSSDIRKYSDLKKTYFYILNNLTNSISLGDQLKKWEIASGLTVEHRSLETEVLFERFLNAENEIKEAIAISIWQNSIKLKNKSDLAMDFLGSLKEKAEEEGRANLHDSISAYFLIEAVTQMIVNDESASSVYFMISEPEETVDLNEDGDLVTSFDFSPLSYLSDFYSQDFKEDLLAGIINGMFKVKNGYSKPPLMRSNVKLMVTGHLQRDSLLLNNTKKDITFHIVSTSGTLYKNTLRAGSRHGFVFNNDSQMMRIKSEDGREYEIKPYKKYHFEENQ